MRIVLTGGGTGGHFYPIVAVAEAVRAIVHERKLLEPELYFLGPSVFDERALYDNDVRFIKTPAGKMRRYFSLLNITDSIKTLFGIVKTLWVLYQLYPDVVFSKGGFGSAPTVFAAKVLRIPLVVHDSDAVPGRVTLYAAPFARRIALSFDEAIQYFPKKLQDKIAVVGNPVRTEALRPAKDGAHEFMELEKNVPVILVLGGSQGAEAINDVVMDALPDLIQRYQVVHQTGEANFVSVSETAKVVLDKNERRYRYKPFPYLTTLALKMAAGAADLVISRAGSGGIAEISAWGLASIIIPLPNAAQDHQRFNAFAYARSGACVVLEQANLAPHLLVSEIDRLFTNPKARNDMAEAAKKYAKPDAARAIAEELLSVVVSHVT
jgi:UDP-N-acetylglucosamine--N-acetylmuramyl-(pentapeptide) pyrophosphoryl-undecaprenol N-acetylglucosamine transferase